MKKDKKGIIIVVIILCTILGIFGGYFLGLKTKPVCNSSKNKTVIEKCNAEEKTGEIINKEKLDTMTKVSEKIFSQEKESLKVEDLTDQEKIGITVSLLNTSHDGTTGAEIIAAFHKYFGDNQKIELVDIYDETSGEKIYRYDKDTDKYVVEHVIGYESVDYVTHYIGFDSVSETNDEVLYNAKVIYLHVSLEKGEDGWYKTYSDAENWTNELEKISHNNYGSNFDEDKKRFETYNDKLDTYVFKFKKDNNNLIFVSYEKK